VNKFKAVLFDFDGVIARTMEDNYAAWKKALSEEGIALAKDDYFLLEGINTRELARQLLANNNKDLQLAEALSRRKDEYYLLNNNFSLYEGAVETVRALKAKGYKLAIVTAANFTRLSNTLAQNIINVFDSVITGDKSPRGKPFADPYLAAAKELTLRPQECVVVENAPIGIEAAKNAGMYCIAITSTLNARYLTKADKIVADISEITTELGI